MVPELPSSVAPPSVDKVRRAFARQGLSSAAVFEPRHTCALQAYFEDHAVEKTLAEALAQIIREKPTNPLRRVRNRVSYSW